MTGRYQITDWRPTGLPCVEVQAERFDGLDLYKFVGQHNYHTSFEFRPHSPTATKYGRIITGITYYDFADREAYQNGNADVPFNPGKLRIDCVDPTISQALRNDLKYKGAQLDDLIKISYLPYSQEAEGNEFGHKVVPNIVKIEADLSDIDESALTLSYLTMKHNNGDLLLDFEREKLVGTILGMHNYRIDSRILATFGFTVQDVKENEAIQLKALHTKHKRVGLTSEENGYLADLTILRSLKVMKYILAEAEKAGVRQPWDEDTTKAIHDLIASALRFEPHVLLHGKRQIYWDVQSYVHIAMRHLYTYQVGAFRQKTALPYGADDLESLIMKVLGAIQDEIHDHFSTKQTPFSREGGWAVMFNGDHYNVRIAATGRLEQFHNVRKRESKD